MELNFKQYFYNNCSVVKTDKVENSIFTKIESFIQDFIKKVQAPPVGILIFLASFQNFQIKISLKVATFSKI